MQKPYTDIDYDAFPVADLTADIHWIQLPAARWAPIRQKLQQDRLNQRLADLPKNHKVILVPADPDYSPGEEELWPIVNHTILQTLAAQPETLYTVADAVREVLAKHRGWRNPHPVKLSIFVPQETS